MRAHGVIDEVVGFGTSGHICWDYDAAEGFLEPGLAWAAEGLANKLRVIYTARRADAALVDDLGGLGSLGERARETGALLTFPWDVLHIDSEPSARLAVYDHHTRTALRDGYAGLRVLAESTPIERDLENDDAHARWEQLLDDYMVDHPLAAFCAYDRRALDPDTTAALSCVHPLRRGRSSGATFGLFATSEGLHLEGDVDTFQAPFLDRSLETRARRGAFVLRIDGGAFLDAGSTGVIAKHAERAVADGEEVRIYGANDTTRRVWGLLGYAAIAPIHP